MLRSPLGRALAIAAALVVAACSDEFLTDPLDGRAARLEAVEWPSSPIFLGDTITLHVRAIDEASGAGIQPQGIDWEVLPGFATDVLHADGDSIVLHVVSLVPLRVSASLEHEAFDTASFADTLDVHLKGIDVSALSGATLASIGAADTIEAHGFDAGGNPVFVDGWSWSVHGDAAVVTATTGDSARVTALANGSVWVVAEHALCTGACRDSVLVTVAQVPASVRLPDDFTLRALGATATITAEARDAGGSVIAGASVVLSQLDGAGSASLSGSTVTAIAPGSARIVGSLGGHADTVTVGVTQVPYFLTLSPDSIQFSSLGARADLTLTVRDSLDNEIPDFESVTWETSAGTVVSVDPDSDPVTARIEAEGNGQAFVRARVGSLVAETHVAVAQVATSLQAVSGANQSGLINTLLPDSLRIEARDAAGSPVAGVPVTWSVPLGGGSVAGAAMTGANGRAAVAWTLGSLVGAQQARATIAGVDPVVFNATGLAGVPASITIEPASAALTFITDTAELRATVRDGSGNVLPLPVVWSSTNPLVASVGVTTGVVTAVTNGTASIIATSGLLADTAEITVQQVVATITLSASADTLSVGDSIQLTATARDAGGATIPGAPISWTSTDELVGTVSTTGRVRAVARGTADIVASSNGAIASFDLTVASFALAFDGGDLLEIAPAAALTLDSAFTLELWVRPRSTAGGALIAKWGGSSSGQSYGLYLRGLVPRMLIRHGNPAAAIDSVTATMALVPDVWHHVAFVFDDGTATMYVNGVVAGTAVGVRRPIATGTPVRVGTDASAAPAWLTGDIDEIRVWQVARTPAEILASQSLRLTVQPGLSVYYPLYLGAGDPVDLAGGLLAVRGAGLGAGAMPTWILDGSATP